MSRHYSALLLAAVVGGCAAGPGYHPEQVVPAATRVGAAPSSAPARQFFDSLAAARDTAAVAAKVPAKTLLPDSLASLEWLDIFRDSTLQGLVRTALSQNRDLQTAISRVREFRADVGIARAPLFPELTANGSVSTNQVAIGSFPPTQYDAFRLTADVAWELDFWGRTRRGIEAARADLGSEEAGQRAVVLSLVRPDTCRSWSWIRSDRWRNGPWPPGRRRSISRDAGSSRDSPRSSMCGSSRPRWRSRRRPWPGPSDFEPNRSTR
jgi:Outer membrane efflux protein